VQKLGSKFREAALQECEQEERVGILTLAHKSKILRMMIHSLATKVPKIVLYRVDIYFLPSRQAW
jgi:hypothetical protein